MKSYEDVKRELAGALDEARAKERAAYTKLQIMPKDRAMLAAWARARDQLDEANRRYISFTYEEKYPYGSC